MNAKHLSASILIISLSACASVELPEYIDLVSFDDMAEKRALQVEEGGADNKKWGQYMNRYINYPSDCSQKKGPRIVELVFSHNKKGRIDNISTKSTDKKSLCYAANFYNRRYAMMPFSPYFQQVTIPKLENIEKQ